MEKTIVRLEKIVPRSDSKTGEVWTTYLPHAKYVMAMSETSEQNLGWSLLERIGKCEMILGQYRAAEETYRQLVLRAAKALGQEHPLIASYKNELGIALSEQTRYREAETMFREAIVLREKTICREDKRIRFIRNNLAIALRRQGHLEEAEQIYRLMIAMNEETLGKNHTRDLNNMSNLAAVLSDQDKKEEVEQIF